MALILSSSDAFASTRLAVFASWANDNEGEESVCRRIRVHILKGINIIDFRHTGRQEPRQFPTTSVTSPLEPPFVSSNKISTSV